MPIRAALFDLGGTLFSYGTTAPHFGALLADLARRHGIEAPVEELRGRFREAMAEVGPAIQARPYYLHRELFTDGFREWLRRFEVAEPRDHRALYEGQIRVGVDHVALRPGALETLAELRAQGLHLGIVSNIDDDQFEPLIAKLGLAPCFDATTTSEEARSCKPDAGIYRIALEKAGGPAPEDVLFIGDSPRHDLAGAIPLGMRTALIARRPPELPEALRPHHVIGELPELIDVVRRESAR